MTVKQSICNGSEVVFDGNTWGLVTDTALENNEVQIMDEDGGEDWVDLNRVDTILDSASPEGREHELRVARFTINAGGKPTRKRVKRQSEPLRTG